MILVAPDIISVTLGTSQDPRRHYTPWPMMGSINPPAIVMTQVLRRPRWLLPYDALLLTGRIGALLVAGNADGTLATVAAYAIMGAVCNVILMGSMGWFAYRAPRTFP